MKIIFRRKNRLFILALVLPFSFTAMANGMENKLTEKKELKMMTSGKTIWQTIDELSGRLTKEKVEKLFKINLPLDASGYVSIYRASIQPSPDSSIKLADGVIIDAVDFRNNNKPDDPGFLVLETSGKCVNRDMVRDHYGELTITDSPRGHSLDEATSYTAFLPWGELSFSFKERNRECLASIAFEPSTGNGKSMD